MRQHNRGAPDKTTTKKAKQKRNGTNRTQHFPPGSNKEEQNMDRHKYEHAHEGKTCPKKAFPFRRVPFVIVARFFVFSFVLSAGFSARLPFKKTFRGPREDKDGGTSHFASHGILRGERPRADDMRARARLLTPNPASRHTSSMPSLYACNERSKKERRRMQRRKCSNAT